MNNTVRAFLLSILLSCCLILSTGTAAESGDPAAPPEAPVKYAYVGLKLPPEGWTSAVAWAQAVHDQDSSDDSYVEVDYLNLYCTVDGRQVLLAGESSDQKSGIKGGGLYYRDPWYHEDIHEDLSIDHQSETVIFQTSSRPDKVWHWWGTRAVVPENAAECWAEARFRISGPAWTQIGLDFWKDQTIGWCGDNMCNTGAAASDWVYGSADWRTLATPLRSYSDFDGDGMSDILWRHAASGQIYIWFMNGSNIENFKHVHTIDDTDWQIKGLGDFDGDGKTDILWEHVPSGTICVWLMDGADVSYYGYVYSLGDTDWQIADVGDFNGDDKTDILWRHASSGIIYAWLMDGASVADIGYISTIADSGWQVEGADDFNGDGKADILWKHDSSGIIYIWFMDNLNISSAGYVITMVDTDWQIEAVGDFDNDDKGDILWRNAASGDIYIWLMDGGAITSYDYVYNLSGSDWQVGGVADYNSGGMSDVLWRKVSTGGIYIWQMAGTEIDSFGYVCAMEDAAWEIVR